MDWIADSTLTPLGDGRFRATLGAHWSSLQGVHGGLVAALAVRAADQHAVDAGAAAGCILRSATFGFVRGSVVGELDLRTETVRVGRSLVTCHVTAEQDGSTVLVARCHHSTPWEGPRFTDVAPPVERPADSIRLDQQPRVTHLANAQTWIHPTTVPLAGAARAEWLAWGRPQGDHPVDAAWLAMYADYFPPAVFARLSAPVRAVSIEYSLQIHRPDLPLHLGTDEVLAARHHAFHSAGGFAVEDGVIHAPDGTVLATSRQTRLAG